MGTLDNRIVLLGAAHGFVINDLRSITDGSTFLYEREHELQNALLEGFAEMAFIERQYQTAYAELLTNGTPELPGYLKEIAEARPTLPASCVIELHAFDLSTYFKSFLLHAKGALDKLVPLYSYRYFDNLKQFSDKGERLIRALKNNKHVTHREQLIALLKKNKVLWIDRLIDMRDEYAHYSSLPAYQNFTLAGAKANQKLPSGISDFDPPTVVVGETRHIASEYLQTVKSNMVAFLNQFLRLCEFTPGRRPKHYLHCDCGYVFAKRSKQGKAPGKLILTGTLELRVKNRDLDYAVIVCPRCQSTTDTDLKFWRDEGCSFSSQHSGSKQ
ncbi:hypothetical protein [Candidatus Accumulibacter vicinus]|uniref:Uncharacterized protein n=1 Tax=Candidatus Accumulibacter vicinus TaxID=2954382 RepID=A0A084Y076_9PROT|nr:hypothetical protein [Candidatus Accumulibacter vicinus]KFB68120.1 MAG: hypothetical protein CAPSK01_002330 [Candidatus Accumulibacter vicinus]